VIIRSGEGQGFNNQNSRND